MVVSLKANKKRILAFLVLAAVVVGACIFLRGGGGEKAKQEIKGGTNEERVAYLQTFGWQVETEPAETREVMIPAQFNDVYTAYNVMQKAQGFDLKPYAGEVCTQYKYKISNYPDEPEVYATLLVYGDLIIGGDVACAEVDGFMHGFAADSARYGETAQDTSSASSAESSQAAGSMAPESSSPASSAVQEESSAPTEDAGTESMEESMAESTAGSTAESSMQDGGEDAESTAGDPIPEDAYPTD